MKYLIIKILVALFPFAFGMQSQYYVVTENFTTEYVDHRYLDFTTKVYRFNNTYAVNMTFLIKIDIPDNMKMNVKGFIKDYRVVALELDKNVKDIVEMESFDLQSLLIRNARPPVVWPIKKGVTYRITDWIPDSSKFPANLPEGPWKVQITEMFANKTAVMVANWYCKIIYKKQKN
ncbi:hypothetical protein ILUMI_02055 [Ignelater luminosus]|uniref:Uncharacterized protein n=1 Tax=Ignelater luminosus TaxID=2038154 RepID=A0A8K0DPH9_IGNLU|nr:hypothetical protein ILUMI_02055 [Ignelater luminosus]